MPFARRFAYGMAYSMAYSMAYGMTAVLADIHAASKVTKATKVSLSLGFHRKQPAVVRVHAKT